MPYAEEVAAEVYGETAPKTPRTPKGSAAAAPAPAPATKGITTILTGGKPLVDGGDDESENDEEGGKGKGEKAEARGS